MVMRGSGAADRPSLPALVRLNSTVLSVRIPKFCKPCCLPPQSGQTRGSNSSLYTLPALLPQDVPQTPQFPWAISSPSLCPPPMPSSPDVPGQSLLFPPPISQLGLPLCANIPSILINSELCLSFLSLSRQKSPPSQGWHLTHISL